MLFALRAKKVKNLVFNPNSGLKKTLVTTTQRLRTPPFPLLVRAARAPAGGPVPGGLPQGPDSTVW